MDKITFEAADPIIDEVADAASVLLQDDSLKEMCRLLNNLKAAVGSQYDISLSLNVDIFDEAKNRTMPLLQTGLSGFGGEKPFQTWGDSSPHRYIADGEILIVPHDRCPKCWEPWDFKFMHPVCANCGATLGVDVKVLLDSDVCPSCEKGKVSMSQPVCKECGYRVDPKMVTWG
jgi:hypothetical protein